ncbi:catechol 2,3-dioxygenase-like lactoylglutathione lyase family enzyme [Thermocatellispora tengchongensis]|uniref:Catechol 2,3-dioxygenase-like lactoylglutathione lyase family enzyme n=1 Tax=Thermocatellispora tengchongensis TaxID=1073253 RepID=A0A840PLT6_9ACTN|nr:VOC family protein [Thermocatellispora tengchongensis]MBB5139876.1 catechol 2,3-dioxygenase-like lactoylglutathione lyase family enzyme [Thermocatellispora tengchongensis]
MRLNHLALAVRDIERSRRFYETFFGFGAGPATSYDDGTLIIRDADGFDLALHPDPEPRKVPDFQHFGFTCRDVAERLAALEDAGVPIVERWSEPGFDSFKCLDPDGYVVEVYWEETTSQDSDTSR